MFGLASPKPSLLKLMRITGLDGRFLVWHLPGRLFKLNERIVGEGGLA